MKATLNWLIEKMCTENAIQDARHDELGLERKQGGKFGTKLVLIRLELICKVYTFGNMIKLTFQCNLLI